MGPLRPGRAFLAASVASVVVLGIANRLLYKMALTPMGGHVFFLAQLQTFGYVAIYFGVLAARKRCVRAGARGRVGSSQFSELLSLAHRQSYDAQQTQPPWASPD